MGELDDLVTFLKACLDEDEAAAPWAADPARALRDIEDRRRQLEEILQSHPSRDHLLRVFAMLDAGHPDYDPGWALAGQGVH